MILPAKALITLFIISGPLTAFSQHFRYAAALEKIETTGFYAIPVSPQLSAHIETDFADIRIADKKMQWVPHILQYGRAVLKEELFTTFPIIQNTITDSGKNLLIVENIKPEGIYNLKVFMKNAAVSRTAVLSGSNNRQDWFIIDDNIVIGRSYEMVKDEYLQEIKFPLAKYHYLKIIIDNMRNDPLFITKAGFYAQPYTRELTGYEDNPLPAFVQKDSNNYTYIEVRQNESFHFDKVSLVISGSKFYSRDMQIRIPALSKSPIARPGNVMANFKLISALPTAFELPRTKTAVFFIVIKNADNPPLKIEKVITQQQTVSLIAYLEQGKKYELQMGDSIAPFPDYDLPTFKDSIFTLHSLHYGKIQAIKTSTDKHLVNQKSNWIWLSIILAGLILSFLTYRLTGDIARSKHN